MLLQILSCYNKSFQKVVNESAGTGGCEGSIIYCFTLAALLVDLNDDSSHNSTVWSVFRMLDGSSTRFVHSPSNNSL